MKRLTPDSPRAAEAGDTLIEVLISTALLGLVVVAMIGGLATTVLGANVHRQQADANTVLVSAMERVKSSEFAYSNVDCSKQPTARRDAYEARARAGSLPSGWAPSAISVSSVRFESITVVSGVPTVSFVPATDGPVPDSSNCTPGLTRQLVTLTLTSPDGSVTPSLSFVKGDV